MNIQYLQKPNNYIIVHFNIQERLVLPYCVESLYFESITDIYKETTFVYT